MLGLIFIGLVAVAGFSVMAQRRLRALGMLSAIGATERNVRLVMIVNGMVVGVAAALAGAVLGFAAWFAYAPTLQQDTGHVVDATNLPWWAIATGIVLAVATSVLASRRPATTMARVPVVAALSGRPATPKAIHRSAAPGVIVFAGGVAFLAFAGGPTGQSQHAALLLLAGLVAVIVGIFLLAPLAISVLAAGAGPRLPVAIRIALRDLVRYRARSGAALAATTFAVFLAMLICVVASIKAENPLNWMGPNLSSSQLIVYVQPQIGGGPVKQLTSAQLASLGRQVDSYAAGLHAQPVLPLEVAGASLVQLGTQQHSNLAGTVQVVTHFTGTVYVATPQLLAMYGIKASQISPGTDILTVRPGLAGLPHLKMTWGNPGGQSGPGGGPGGGGNLSCTPSNDCLPNPVIQTIGGLPDGTSAPNTVITEYAVSRYHMTPQPGRMAHPGTGSAHRGADRHRQAARARLRGDGRDEVRFAEPRRDHRRRHRAGHRDRARRAGHVRRPDPQRDRTRPAHAHRDRRQRQDTADDHRRDRRRARPARRGPRHRRRGDRRTGLDPQ